MKFHIPRGTADVLPGETELWSYIKVTSEDIFKCFNYKEIKTPIFEHTELFQRGVGETTDIVEKEMYTFIDKGNRSITLRPEGTASVVRSYVENKMYVNPDLVKLYYIGPMFRYERPGSGRSRQFNQIGVEVFGSKNPAIDAEVISMAMLQFEKIGLHQIRLEINSVGCKKCRPNHRESLMEHLSELKDDLCKDCKERFDRNPMRILDCKNETCRKLTENSPTMDLYLCEECQNHYKGVKKNLDILGIEYIENPRLVRGLDYYTQTAFEIMSVGEGVEGTLCGGGRYNGLVEEFGGTDVPGIGYAFSIERILALKSKELLLDLNKGLDVFLIALGEDAKSIGIKILNELRINNISAETDYLDRKMKVQMKSADRLRVKKVIIIGDDEIAENKAIVRDMTTGIQEEFSLNNLVSEIKQKL
ncbi:MAG: histidine--tRNA ligase [Vulcanibacillus sp.]